MRSHIARCYGNKFKDLDHRSFCAGLWGGEYNNVQCMMNCLVEQLKFTSGRGQYNCNMMVYNWCKLNSNCTKDDIVDDNPVFTNPFRENCDDKYLIIHDKCEYSKNRCVSVMNGTLTRRACNTTHGYYGVQLDGSLTHT